MMHARRVPVAFGLDIDPGLLHEVTLGAREILKGEGSRGKERKRASAAVDRAVDVGDGWRAVF